MPKVPNGLKNAQHLKNYRFRTRFFGPSYAETLRRWNTAFLDTWPVLQQLGFDERFRRMWHYYLCYSEVGFDTGKIDVARLLSNIYDKAKLGAVTGRQLLAYALPAFVVALPTIPVYIHLPTLYGVQLGIGLATTGYILLITRLFDTVTDPLVGFLCDRLKIWNLRRKPWIALGAIVAGIGLYKV